MYEEERDKWWKEMDIDEDQGIERHTGSKLKDTRLIRKPKRLNHHPIGK